MKNIEKKKKKFFFQKDQDLISVDLMSMSGALPLRKTACPSFTILYIHCMFASLTLSPGSNNMVLLNYLSIWPACPECINYCRIYS